MRNSKLKEEYESLRHNYSGAPFDSNYLFNSELVDKVINELKRGKAAGLDTLTAEHLQYNHPAIATVLSKLFNLIITGAHIPPRFGMSFTVTLLKSDSICGRAVNVEDIRGISINPVISKILEHCIIELFSKF